MCGIFGLYSPNGADQQLLTRMAKAVAHRGPDDEGLYLAGPVGLGNRRLSIIDLDHGRQPISNEDGTIWITYNGEIYNYPQLRRQLAEQGHRFRTESDTEVIVHLYEEYGDEFFKHLKGMFAFALWDANRHRLILARDRLGQKPLYYHHNNGNLSFASEIKAILAIEQQPPEIDYESLHHFLSLRFVPSPQTMFKGIQKLPPAHFMVFQDGHPTLKRYWRLSFLEKVDSSETQLLDELETRLAAAVESHLISDVPLGAFLSGGMDSSMILAMMARTSQSSISAFAIGVEEQDFNELPYARQVAAHTGARLHERSVRAELIRLLPRIIWHMDEPSDPIAACMYHAASLAAEHVKVVLGGDGGDELFAGFDRYQGLGYLDLYGRLPGFLREQVLAPLIKAWPDNYGYKSLSQKVRWASELAAYNSPADRYAQATLFFRFSHLEKQSLFRKRLWKQLSDLQSAQILAKPFNENSAYRLLDRMLYTDYVTRLPEHSLMLTDRMTMAHGLEARSPFLDHELVECLAAFPPDFKIRGGTLKYGLRKLALGYLPPTITSREKQGFMFPVAYWFRDQLYPLLRATLPASVFITSGVFDPVYVTQLIEEHRTGKRDNHVRLWMLLNLDVWHRLYFQNQSPDEVTALLEVAGG